MTRFILDASVSLAWFIDGTVPELASRVRRSLEGGSRAVVPPLWRLEVANGFAMAERRRDLDPHFVDRCLDDLEGLMASVIDEAATLISLRHVHSVARSFGLSAYDATYLEIARREHLPLATLDRALSHAATKAGVPLVH